MTGIILLIVIFEILLLQTVNTKAQEDLDEKISKLESQFTSLAQSLQAERAQVKSLKKRLEREEDKMLILQGDIEPLKQHLLTDLSQEKEGRVLNTTGQFERHGTPSIVFPKGRHARSADPDVVAFTAMLKQVLNDVPLHTTIKFDHRVHWTNHFYDETTGVFTCPTSGLYLFAVFIETHSVKTSALVHLLRDGIPYMSVISERSNDGEDDTGGNVVLLSVTKGQRLWVETYSVDNQSFWPTFTTFSGVLIHRY